MAAPWTSSPSEKDAAFNKNRASRNEAEPPIATLFSRPFYRLPPPSPTARIFICTVAFRHYRQGRSHISVAGAYNSMGRSMKKVALALALVVAGLSLGGCFVGKGKAPAPVVTKG
jgi:hypothetical protein